MAGVSHFAHEARRAIGATDQRVVELVIVTNDPDAVHVAQPSVASTRS